MTRSRSRREADDALAAAGADARLRRRRLCELVAWICAELERRRLGGVLASGNVSAFDPELNVVAITARGVALRDVTSDEVVVVGVDPGFVARPRAGLRPSTELPLHLAAYRTCHWPVAAVVHAHAPFMVAASCLQLDRLPLVHYHQALLGDVSTPIVPYARPGSDGLAALVADAFASERTKAVLLGNHGAVVAAATPAEGADLAEALEDVCRLVVLLGDRVRPLPHEELPPLIEFMRAYRDTVEADSHAG